MGAIRGPTLAERAIGLLRLTHPFPSVLDGIATGGIALLAGAAAADAARLGVAMIAIQASIGATNDVADASADAIAKPGKPIPAGLVSARGAAAVATAAALVGLSLSIPSGWGTVVLAAAGLAVGLAYDLWLKGTPWSWLPYAVGVPLLPVYAWYGGSGTLPATFAILVPAAMAAGAALAIGNARTDVEGDRASGVASVATALGAHRAWALEVGLLVVVGAAAIVAAAVAAGTGGSVGRVALVGVAALLPIGTAIGSRDLDEVGRVRAWQAEAVGLAVLAVAWLWAVLG
jgi:4-hydroxybenzoate polyprenyltransferase